MPDLASLERVNSWVNRAISPAVDGPFDVWTHPLADGSGTLGDCEDYAMEKQRLLIDAGWPRSSLRLAIAVHPRLGTHAVLIATTSQGDFVLDNLSPAVRHWNDTGYVFLSRQSRDDDLAWTKIR